MNDISKQIDLIVREVVRRLTSENPEATTTNQNYISDRVVTLAQVESKLNGTNEIFVRTDAVVTPAVRDLLREKSVRLVRRSIGQHSTRPVLVAICDCDLNEESVSKKLIGLDLPTDVFVENADNRLIERIGEATDKTENSVVITSRPYRFSCLANRNEKIRAIVAHDTKSAARAKKEAAANVLVLDGATICPQIIRSFCAAM